MTKKQAIRQLGIHWYDLWANGQGRLTFSKHRQYLVGICWEDMKPDTAYLCAMKALHEFPPDGINDKGAFACLLRLIEERSTADYPLPIELDGDE